MSGTHSFTRNFVANILRVALVAALVAAVWGVYRRLPTGEGAVSGVRDEQHGAATLLHIRLRASDLSFPVSAEKIPVQLYPISMTAARNEFISEPRPGQRFEEFVTRLMGDRQPLTAELNARGETALAVPPGKWWVHATVNGARELTWRLPINVSGSEMTVELTPKNAYTLAKKF
ncbi:MAG TPA: hypothetical protein VEX60_14535 [Pyrinomonadaceae bacterium]|nr:hypothetical protein [Pyrinomonadaceae bacterium]